jgi:protein-S-isoprenylcysteine O-methyltransferase Ste14
VNWRLVRTIIVLPGTALVFIPAAILWAFADTKFAAQVVDPGQVLFWFALVIACSGLALSIWTVTLFTKFGDGTPAPWDPPKKLVIRGPYRHVRNPMITSVLLILLAEAILFQSWTIAAWMVVFFIGNAIYFPLKEERELERRFGDDYRAYKAQVPSWIPRLRGWSGLLF